MRGPACPTAPRCRCRDGSGRSCRAAAPTRSRCSRTPGSRALTSASAGCRCTGTGYCPCRAGRRTMRSISELSLPCARHLRSEQGGGGGLALGDALERRPAAAPGGCRVSASSLSSRRSAASSLAFWSRMACRPGRRPPRGPPRSGSGCCRSCAAARPWPPCPARCAPPGRHPARRHAGRCPTWASTSVNESESGPARAGSCCWSL